MAAAALSATTFPTTTAGVNLTDASFTTLVAGAGNGVVFTYDANDVIFLKNDTGGPAVFSFTTKTPTSMSAYGITVPTADITVADSKTYIFRVAEIFSSTAGQVTITCDVAGKVLVLDR